MNKTTVYLIRHSVRFDDNLIESYKTSQDIKLRYEKIILSVEGEKRAEILSNEKELQNIDVVYTSNMVRTLQTAKYLLDKQNLKANIDERFGERISGKPNDDIYPNWFELQYQDINFKTEGGESQLDVRKRFTSAFNEIVNQNKGKRIAIFAHGLAITFFLLQWCKLVDVKLDHTLTMSYNDKIILDKIVNAPEVFKVTLDVNNEIENIELIEFDDLK